MTNFKITDTHNTYTRVSKNITLTNKDGDEIVFNKWYIDSDDGEYDNGYDVMEGKEVYDKLTDEEQDEITDLIINYKI